jgi:hypothetical protein
MRLPENREYGVERRVVKTISEFEAAEAGEFDGVLLALWWDRKGDWERAHAIAQGVGGADGAWVHAYLHRKDGDVGNAAYWYQVARRGVAEGDLRREWEGIVDELLARK